MKQINLMEICQPIGSFYMGKMLAKNLIEVKVVNRLQEGKGVQRLLKNGRVRAISLFCKDPDATFPTPIILSVKSSDMKKIADQNGIEVFEYDENVAFAEILDGQHRIEGIKKSKLTDIEVPVIIMFDLSEEQKAYIFSTINGNQERVNQSVIYELFGLFKTRSAYKTCHEIARALNSDSKSPFYRRLKMLEKREYATETISQNTFVTSLCRLITNTPQEDAIALKQGKDININEKLAFSKYFKSGDDAVILKILLNYFNAAKNVFPEEWDNTDEYILTKTVGFSGLMDALNKIIPVGEKEGDLSEKFFRSIFEKYKNFLEENGLRLTSEDFQSSGAVKARISGDICEIAYAIFDK